MSTNQKRPPIPPQLAPFYEALADIAHMREIERRKHCRLIVEVADEIEREEPPPPQFRPGVEMIHGHAWIDETGGVQ